ncbi:MAG: hypothetical protein AAGD14_18385 [Planctomycetota bacterium]
MRLLPLLLLVSCGPVRFYEGPRLASDEIAQVVVDGAYIEHDQRFEARLLRFDGVPNRSTRKEFEVLPGEHEFDVSWTRFRLLRGGRANWDPIDSGTLLMKFEVRAGFRYTLFWHGEDPPIRFRERPLAP